MDIAFLLLFAAVLIWLGWAFGDVSTATAYAVANRTARALFVAFGAFTVVGASTFVGVTQFTYLVGVLAVALGVGAALGAFMLGRYGLNIYRRAASLQYNTLPDALAGQYGNAAGTLATIISILALGALLVIQVDVGGTLIANLTTLSPAVSSFVLIIVVATYVHIGGLKAIFLTDVLQGIAMFVLIGGALVAIYVVGLETPDAQAFIPAMPSALGFSGVSLIIVLLASGFLSISGGADVWLRFLSAASPEQASRGLKCSALLFFVFLIILTFLGLHIVAQLPDANPTEAFVDYLTGELPSWIMPFITLGIFAGAISTADAEGHVISSMVLTEKVRWQSKSARTPMGTKFRSALTRLDDLNVARWSTIGVFLLAFLYTVLVGHSVGQVFNAFLNLIMATGAAAWMLITSRGTRASMCIGLTLGAVMFFVLYFKGVLLAGLWSLLIPLTVFLPNIWFSSYPQDDSTVTTQNHNPNQN